MRRSVLVFSSFLLFAPSLLLAWGDKKQGEFHDPTPAELAMKNVAFAPDAPAAVLEWLQYKDDVNFRSTEYVRIKVFKDEGKKYGDIELVYIPRLFSIRDLQARTIRPDGTVSTFNGKVYEKVIVKSGGFRVMAKTFSLPDVQPGCIIEYRYDQVAQTAAFVGYGTHFTVQREIPIVKTNLWMRPMNRLTSFFTYRDLPAGVQPQKVDDHFELELTNIQPFEKERYMLPDGELKPEVSFYYMKGGIMLDQFWSIQADSWRRAADQFIGNHRGIRNAAQEITGGAPPSDETLRKIYARVQKVRNLSYEPDKNEQESQKLRDNETVEDVWRNGYGWAWQIDNLFVALARAAGFDAYVVCVAPRDERFFAKNVPLASQIGAVVAVVTVDGKPLYFDPETPYAPYNVLSWEKTNVTGLRLEKKDTADWIETPAIIPAASMVRRAAVVTVDESGVAHAHVTFTFGGAEALERRMKNRNDDEAASKTALTDEVKGWFTHGATVTLTKVTGLKAVEEPIVVEAELVLPDAASKVGSRIIVPMSIFRGAAPNPFTAEKRKHPIYFTHPYEVDDQITLKLPAGMTVESAPEGVTLNAGSLQFAATYAKAADQVSLSRSFIVGAHYLGSEHYPTLRTLFGKVAAADEEQVVLRAGASK